MVFMPSSISHIRRIHHRTSYSRRHNPSFCRRQREWRQLRAPSRPAVVGRRRSEPALVGAGLVEQPELLEVDHRKLISFSKFETRSAQNKIAIAVSVDIILLKKNLIKTRTVN